MGATAIIGAEVGGAASATTVAATAATTSVSSYASMAGVGLSAAGMFSSAGAAKNSADAQKNALEFQAQVAQNNAVYADMQATDALQRGAQAEQKSRLATASLKGTQRADLAARGISLDEGSALNILSDTDFMGERDARTIEDNAAKEAWAYKNAAVNATNNGTLLQAGANQIDPDSIYAGTLLSGAGKVASSWYSYSKK